MKRLIAIVVAITFVFGVASISIAASALDKCNKCHKDEKSLEKVVAAKKIETTDAFIKAVKASPKAKLHEKFTDNDYKAVAKELKLK
ncbi:MAG: hypothetical protein N2511_05910 [Thermodesulfovibrionales bacterium]|nr:hypothetical protein [Thermodesulfovibrionales bacterium]